MAGGLTNPLHLLIILAVALIVLGPKRLPDAGRSLGSALKGFRESIGGDSPEFEAGESTKALTPAPVVSTSGDHTRAHGSADAPAKVAS